MIGKVIAGVILFGVMCGNAQANKDENVLTEQNCRVVYSLTSKTLDLMQNGGNQYDAMDFLNKLPMDRYGAKGYPAKVYMQLVVYDLLINLKKGFRADAIVSKVFVGCMDKVGFKF